MRLPDLVRTISWQSATGTGFSADLKVHSVSRRKRCAPWPRMVGSASASAARERCGARLREAPAAAVVERKARRLMGWFMVGLGYRGGRC